MMKTIEPRDEALLHLLEADALEDRARVMQATCRDFAGLPVKLVAQKLHAFAGMHRALASECLRAASPKGKKR